jgi:hypothetical protein
MCSLAAKAEAATAFQNLVQLLARVGLVTEVRNGENCSLLVFVKVASDERLNNAVYRSRWGCKPNTGNDLRTEHFAESKTGYMASEQLSQIERRRTPSHVSH